jgi:diguanylate cyclase (GGDEF)-like protein
MGQPLAKILQDGRAKVASSLAESLRGMSGTPYASLPLPELKATSEALAEGYLDVLEKGDYAKLRGWIDMAARRVDMGFRLSDVERVILGFKELLLPFLKDNFKDDCDGLAEAVAAIGEVAGSALLEFGELYHSYFREKTESYLRRLEEANRQLREMAVQDSVTRLYNHAYFHETLGVETERAQRYARTLSLIMLDIDGFKAVNDTHGHPFGDQVLRGLAQILRSSLREMDLAARYGGDEFALILPETSGSGAGIAAERLRSRVEREVFSDDRGTSAHITVSLGVATFPHDAENHQEMVKRADRALYSAKAGGGNRVGFAAGSQAAGRD